MADSLVPSQARPLTSSTGRNTPMAPGRCSSPGCCCACSTAALCGSAGCSRGSICRNARGCWCWSWRWWQRGICHHRSTQWSARKAEGETLHFYCPWRLIDQHKLDVAPLCVWVCQGWDMLHTIASHIQAAPHTRHACRPEEAANALGHYSDSRPSWWLFWLPPFCRSYHPLYLVMRKKKEGFYFLPIFVI